MNGGRADRFDDAGSVTARGGDGETAAERTDAEFLAEPGVEGISGAPNEAFFDALVELAANIVDAPLALMNIATGDRHWRKVRIGLKGREVPSTQPICEHTLRQGGTFIVPDMARDERFAMLPFVTSGARLRFYAGVRLETRKGLPLGTLCVLDTQPRPEGLSDRQSRMLDLCASLIAERLDLGREHKALRQVNRTLRESRDLLQTVIDSVDDLIFVKDRTGRFVLANRAMIDGYGLRPGSMDPDGVPDRIVEAYRAGDQQVMATGEPYRFEEMIPIHGEPRMFQTVKVPWRSGEEIIGVIGIARDFTTLKAIEQALRESEEHYRYSVELNPQIPWTATPDGAIDEASPRWEMLTGMSPSEARGDGWMKGVHPDDVGPVFLAWQEAIRTGRSFDAEMRIRAADGSYRWARTFAAPRRDESGAIVHWYGALEDIDNRKLAEKALRESEALTRSIVENSPDCISLTDLEGRMEFLSPGGVRALELTHARALLGGCWINGWGEDMKGQVEAAMAQARRGETARFAGPCSTPRGTAKWWDNIVTPILDSEGRPARLLIISREITERIHAVEALRESEERFRLAARAAGLGVWDYDAVSGALTWSDELKMILGLPVETVADNDVALALVHAEDRPKVETQLKAMLGPGREGRFDTMMRIHRADDRAERWLTMTGWKTLTPTGEAGRVIVTVRDITEEKTAEDRIRWTATHDALTRLPNRILFQQELDQAIRRATVGDGRVGLLMLDVDHFKQINDTLGHDAGDALLQSFTDRLRSTTRDSEMVARLGGDEFAIILRNVRDDREMAAAAERILQRLREPFIHAGRALDCRASIGASLYPDHARDAAELLKNADMALYTAKAAGRGGMMMFAPMMRAEMQRRASMIAMAAMAVEQQHIMPYYQPKVELGSGRLIGFEALMRWRHERLGVQLPGMISAAFEDFDLANAIGNRMLDSVTSDMRRWIDEGVDFGHVAVNASAAEFRRDDLAEQILERLSVAGIPARRLELEVAETVFLGRGAEYVERALKMLSEAGVTIALDDFGTGYASLSHLKQFPVDTIKIDRSFVRDLDDADDAAIIRAVLNLGQSLGIRVVAEGIEKQRQATYLRTQGCDYGQGFLFGKPMPADHIPQVIANWHAGRT